VDIKNAYSPAGGIITFFPYAEKSSYGNFAIIDHGAGIFSLLGQLKSFNPGLENGDNVHKGSFVGIIGNTSIYSMAIHLHWSVFVNIESIWNKDPAASAIFRGYPYKSNRKSSIDPSEMIKKGWDHPAIGAITSPWGPRDWEGIPDYLRFHYGIDYSAQRERG
jgi:murein DD-endopeptidase MepM/ murein hydrolase activator NlpD